MHSYRDKSYCSNEPDFARLSESQVDLIIIVPPLQICIFFTIFFKCRQSFTTSELAAILGEFVAL